MKSIKILILVTLCAFVIAGCISPELRSARIAINEKDWERALISLDQELTRNPGNVEAYWRKGQCYMELNDYKMMSTYFDSSLTASEAYKDTIAYYRNGLMARYVNRATAIFDTTSWVKALTEFGDVIAEYDESFDNQKWRETIESIQGEDVTKEESDAAGEYFLVAMDNIKIAGDISKLKNLLKNLLPVITRIEGAEFSFSQWEEGLEDMDPEGAAKRKMERFTTAIANFDTAIVINPNNSETYARVAIWSYNSKMYDEALEYSSGAIDLGDEKLLIPMYEIRMLTYLGKGDHEETIEWAKKIMKHVNSDDPESEVNYLQAFDALTIAADSLNNMELALDVTKEVVTKFPDNMLLKKNLAILYARLKDYESARRVYETVLAADPNDFDANLTISSILYNDQRWAEAIPYLEKSYEGEPENIKIVTMLMACYFNSDQDDKGQEMREKLEELRETED